MSSLSLSPVLATIKSLVFSHTKLFNLECKEEKKILSGGAVVEIVIGYVIYFLLLRVWDGNGGVERF